MEENILMFSNDELPQTDLPSEKPRVNFVQENLAYLMSKKNLQMVTIQKETLIPWSTLQSWSNDSVKSQLLDINIKELADFLDISIDNLAFVNLRERDMENEQ